jgi:hypothetical protein
LGDGQIASQSTPPVLRRINGEKQKLLSGSDGKRITFNRELGKITLRL